MTPDLKRLREEFDRMHPLAGAYKEMRDAERDAADARIERLEAVVKDLLPLADAWTDERMLGEGPILAARAALEDA